MKKIYTYIFLSIIFIILTYPLTKIDVSLESAEENRVLAVTPVIFKDGSFNVSFFKEFDAWISDRFRGRKLLLDFYRTVEYTLLGYAENARAFEGKDKWLFYKGDDSIANYQNKILFSEVELERIKDNILLRKKKLERNGISYYILIAPDKNRIYGEKYPDYINRINDKSRAEILVDYMQKYGINIVYPVEQINSKKNMGDLYYRLDTHWSEYAGFIAYQEVMKQIRKKYKVEYLSIEDFYINKISEPGEWETMDLLRMLGLNLSDFTNVKNNTLCLKKKVDYKFSYQKFDGTFGKNGIIAINEDSVNKERVVILRDSFSKVMVPYFSESFAYTNFIWSHNFDENYKYILECKPDIVIEEVGERGISVFLQDINLNIEE